jgi:hypothetical protein
VRRICHMAYFCRLGSYFWGRTSENRALCEVRRIPIPRTPVNKGKKKGQGVRPGPTKGPRRPLFRESIPRT